MADLYTSLYNGLDEKKKLQTAVSTNMVDSLETLALSGMNLNEILHHHNGNRAIHIAATSGHTECVVKLLKYGAEADATNVFGFTALALALRSGQSGCVRTLMAHGSPLTDPHLVWKAQNMDETPTWLAYNAACLMVLINATGSLLQYDTAHEERRARRFVKEPELIQMYFLCGHAFSEANYQFVLANVPGKYQKWIKDFGRLRTLQHLTRTVIRQNLQYNVFHASKFLALPRVLQDYLIIVDSAIDDPNV